MSIRSKIITSLAAVGATKLAEKLADKQQTVIESETPLPAPKPKRIPRPGSLRKQGIIDRKFATMMDPAKRSQRQAYYASYKGGKHRRGVPQDLQLQFIHDAVLKRDRKAANRARQATAAMLGR